MTIAYVCPICGEKVSPDRDQFVHYQEKHEEKPMLWAHAKCMSAEAKRKD
jgi:hypothetical protein